MVIVVFEFEPIESLKDRYFELATALREEVGKIDGFISVERFESINNAGRFVSLSTWQDMAAVKRWREHLQTMEHLKEGIHLRGYAQKDPKKEYAKEGFDLFSGMMDTIKANVVSVLMRVQLDTEDQVEALQPRRRRPPQRMTMGHGGEGASTRPTTVKRAQPKVGRNDPCPCGSGKKYKKCHYAAHQASPEA